MERYYFETIGLEPNVKCTEKCMVKNNGTMIGSVSCQYCPYMVENNQDEYGGISWIVCQRIKEATVK